MRSFRWGLFWWSLYSRRRGLEAGRLKFSQPDFVLGGRRGLLVHCYHHGYGRVDALGTWNPPPDRSGGFSFQILVHSAHPASGSGNKSCSRTAITASQRNIVFTKRSALKAEHF